MKWKKISAILTSFLFLFSNFSWSFPDNYSRTIDTLGVRSIFSPISELPEDENYRIKDIALLQSWFLQHLMRDNDFVAETWLAEEYILSEQTRITFHGKKEVLANEKKQGIVVPCTLKCMEDNFVERPLESKYFVYIGQGVENVTVYSETEYEKAKDYTKRSGIQFCDIKRPAEPELEAFVKHELWTDRILAGLKEGDRIAIGRGDYNVVNVARFFSTIGLSGISKGFTEFVSQGRVFKVKTTAVVSINDGGRMIEVPVTDKRVKVEHASNIAIHVLDWEDHRKLQLALIHEAFARSGIPDEINDDTEVMSLVEAAYANFLGENSSEFSKNKNALLFTVTRLLEKLNIEKKLGAFNFDVDLNVLRKRDYSFPVTFGVANDIVLEESIKEIEKWKNDNRGGWDTAPDYNHFTSKLREKAYRIYEKNKLYNHSISDILTFVSHVYDGNNYASVLNNIHIVLEDIGLDFSRNPEQLGPTTFHEMAGKLGLMESGLSFNETDDINFTVGKMVFDLFGGEKRIAELLWLEEEIQKELNNPGTGRLPEICAMQDIHGASERAMALTGFALGLPDNILDKIKTLKDLQRILLENDIDIDLKDIRFVGMNDLYDRGDDPIGAFELVEWLRSVKKLKHVMGNHDYWRGMAVLGVDRHFLETGKMTLAQIKGKGKDEYGMPYKCHHPAYWAYDIFRHPDWCDVEIDQVNERKVYEQIRGVNNRITGYNNMIKGQENTIALIDGVHLRGVRKQAAKIIKPMKKYNDAARRG
ncbi:MAG: hypothetical protein ABH883_03470, partial [Candidatus Omnitrophota bacterium]